MRLVFMGTPDFAVPALRGLLEAGHHISAVYTQPPRRAGRGKQLRRTPVHEFAVEHGIEVRTPKTLKDEAVQAEFSALDLDAAIVAAYGLILPAAILQAPKYGCFNIHASLLPRWRGAAPIQRAIMAGDEQTGITIMRIDEGLDTGDMCLKEARKIGADMTAGDLHDELSATGGTAIVKALEMLSQGMLDCTPQPESGISYADKISKKETRIDWSGPAQAVHNHIRGLSPFPGAWFEAASGERVKVLQSRLAVGDGAPGHVLDDNLTIACGSGVIKLAMVQRAGKKPVGAQAFLRGFALKPGDVLL